MTLIGQFNNAPTRLNLLSKKPLFLSLNHRPNNAWYNRTNPLSGNAAFPGLTQAEINGMVVGNAVHVPNNAVIEQNNITLYLNLTSRTEALYSNAPVYELHAYQHNPGGALGCQYLSWEDSCIVSMDLSNAGPPLFMSGPFNGCHFYVTRDTVNNQLRVHHANANKVGEAANHNRPDLAEHYLDALMQAAIGPNENIVHQMRKSQYLAKIWNVGVNAKIESGVTLAYRNRKTAQNRGSVALHETMCLVFGVRTAVNTWDFFFHVAGIADYTRPGPRSNRTGYLKSIIPWQQI
ncbi:hypothetical protein JRI60_20600 [Archangium violaceum]|uniref:hypothetical protein n=1 Tax=Archangium violaceum TaxID=83451 RepID=UPI0019522384|nr:hypothetical protein [Archangium violaceum]QRO01253.1 hypothetical protein JRI60_20600 [Archangium violaceum]